MDDPSYGSPLLIAGIEQEIASLYKREAPGVLRYANALANNKETAQDALQEAFFRFFLCRSAGREVLSPKAWLFRVAHNYVLDQKKAGFRNEIGIESLLNMPCPDRYPETGCGSSDLLPRLLQSGLSPKEIECVRLRTEGLRYDEVARLLRLQVGTVGTLLARAHGKLRQAAGEVVFK